MTSSKNSDIFPWQAAPWEQLMQQHQAGRLPHALLITGALGLGQQAFAEALVTQLFCEKKLDQPCNHCRPCQLIQQNTHPDWHRLSLGDKEQRIKIEAVRTVIAKLHETPQQGQWRAVVINPADAMTQEAANALLKTVEAPGDNVLLLLLTSHPHRILATLRSRCQPIHLKAPNVDVAYRWLQTRLSEEDLQPEAVVKGLLALHGHAPLETIKAIKNKELTLFKCLLGGLVKIGDQRMSPTELAQQCANYDPQCVLTYLYKIIQSFIFRYQGLPSPLDYFALKPGFEQRLQQLLERRPYQSWLDFLKATMAMKEQLQHHISLDKRLQLEGLFAFCLEGEAS